MKLYPKKLNSLEELKREKQVLKYAKKHTTSNGFLPFEKIKGEGSMTAAEPNAFNQSDVLSIFGDLATSKSLTSAALSLGLPLLKLAGRKAEKGVFRTVGGEIIGGYLKWKVIQFAFKRIKGMMSSKKKKEKE
jgi:hypothetical protein